MARQMLALIFPPLLGLFIIALGNGFLSTLVPLRLASSGVSVGAIGLISAAYYAGLCIGALFNERLLLRIGYIRAYACFAAIVAVSSLAQALWVNVYWWFLLRLLCGLATVGVYLVIESWLLTGAAKHQRGRVLAFYMISYYGALAMGQLFIGLFDDTPGTAAAVMPFVVIGMLAALSLLPIAIIPRLSPLIDFAEPLSPFKLARITPTGVAGAFGSGILMGAVYSLLPLYLQSGGGYSLDQIGVLMAMVIVGGMALQYPIGRWSDQHDRQWVLIIIAAVMLVLVLLAPLAAVGYITLMVALFLVGGCLFALYPVSMSHSADRAPPETLVGMTQGMLLINSLGAAVSAPLITPLMSGMGNNGLFVGIGAVLVVLLVFFGWRRSQRPAPQPMAPFFPAPAHSAVGAELGVTQELIEASQQAQAELDAHEEDAEREIAEEQALIIERQLAREGTPLEELRMLSEEEEIPAPRQDDMDAANAKRVPE